LRRLEAQRAARVRFASSLAAALPDDIFEQAAGFCEIVWTPEFLALPRLQNSL